MSAPETAASSRPAAAGVRVLLFSDDALTRESVRMGVGRRPATDVEIGSWEEFATAPVVISSVEAGGFDLLILDGESAPYGGIGLCRQLKSEIYDCPPVIVLTGRAEDAWLASWSYADAVVPHPLDPLALATTVADVVRRARRGELEGMLDHRGETPAAPRS